MRQRHEARMQLLEWLEARLRGEESAFRSQLLREDLARLERLRQLAGAIPDAVAFRKEAMMIEWTPGNARTRELEPALGPLLEAFHAAAVSGTADGAEERLLTAWQAFEARRLERLVGCLARVPRPE
jgi:hypothetical protein